MCIDGHCVFQLRVCFGGLLVAPTSSVSYLLPGLQMVIVCHSLEFTEGTPFSFDQRACFEVICRKVVGGRVTGFQDPYTAIGVSNHVPVQYDANMPVKWL